MDRSGWNRPVIHVDLALARHHRPAGPPARHPCSSARAPAERERPTTDPGARSVVRRRTAPRRARAGPARGGRHRPGRSTDPSNAFQVSTRRGWSPNARQIRPTASRESPASAAIERVDLASRALAPSPTCARARPRPAQRRSSADAPNAARRPARPAARRQTDRVSNQPSPPQPARWPPPPGWSAPARRGNTIRERTANARAPVRRRAQPSNRARSSAVSSSTAFGRPRPATPKTYKNFRVTTLACSPERAPARRPRGLATAGPLPFSEGG